MIYRVNKQTMLYFVAVATLGLAALLIGYIFLQLAAPVKVLEMERSLSLPVTNTNKVATAGGMVTFDQKFCKLRDLDLRVKRELISKDIILEIPPSPNTKQFPVGCHTNHSSAAIPENAPPGIYRVYLFMAYDFSPLRTINYTFRTEPFEVRNDKL